MLNKEANGYRLPTEAEWEFAAGGGVFSEGYHFSGSNNLDIVAWTLRNAIGKLQPVGRRLPNALGLYDMNGNVEEWCWDWFADYSEAAQNNPLGPDSGKYKIIKGGSRKEDAQDNHITARTSTTPDSKKEYRGFRIVRNGD